MDSLPANPVHIWLMHTPALRAEQIQHCLGILEPAERRRFSRLAKSADRVAYLTAHTLRRVALSQQHPIEPGNWKFQTSQLGKPVIIGPAGATRFCTSISHSTALVACAVSEDLAVGVDVEHIDTNVDIASLARLYLSDQEYVLWSRLSAERQRHNFYAYWTLKEAYVKATGLGMSATLQAIGFSIDGSEQAPRLLSDSSRPGMREAWQFLLSTPTLDHKLAVAVQLGDSDDTAIEQQWMSLDRLLGMLRC